MKKSKIVLFGVSLLIAGVYAETDTLNPMISEQSPGSAASGNVIIKTDTIIRVDTIVLSRDQYERIRERIEDSLETALERFEDSLEAAQERIEDSLEQLERQQDTLDASDLASKLHFYREAFTEKISKSRAQGYGGGVVFQPMLLGLSVKPVYDLARRDKNLKNCQFPDLTEGYKPVLVLGALLYGGVGQGVRVGFGGWSGDIYFASKEVANDSVMVLGVNTTFGGLLVEKAFLRKNLNFVIGGMLGGGNLTVNPKWSTGAFESFFDFKFDEEKEVKAPFAAVELHTGLTATVLPWMHVGADINGHFFLSVNGFGSFRESFMTVNPGLRLRLVLGNLG